MARGCYKPNKNLYNTLLNQGRVVYTVTGIRDLLLKSGKEKRNKSDMRRWINGQFKTLLKHGLIESSPSIGKRAQFNNTDKLFDTNENIEFNEQAIEQMIPLNQLTMLKKRLRNYQMDILISSGETKECEEIAELIPAMRNKVQKQYNVAKENNIELIGRIKVLETLISEFE
ncbi:hypothetical protein ACFO4O_11660 [Glaciecola siphonariae]|uniref:Uncharacterized protein n=1 Tax=Glaciecola siphonariae TaxID=521012 RepID=A0ABV9LZF6_9ALTE